MDAERAEVRRRLDRRARDLHGATDARRRLSDAATTAARDAARSELRAKEAARQAAAVRAEATALRTANAELHAQATDRLDAMAVALADVAGRELTYRADLVEAGTLLLQTHVALGTDVAASAKLSAVRDRLSELAFAPPAAYADALLAPLGCERLPPRTAWAAEANEQPPSLAATQAVAATDQATPTRESAQVSEAPAGSVQTTMPGPAEVAGSVATCSGVMGSPGSAAGVAGVAAVGGSGQVVAATGLMGVSAMAARRVRAVVPAGRL